MDVEKEVVKTIKKYGLMKKSDKVVVALSGGKDSTSVLYILKKLGYDVHGLMIDLYLGEWSEIHKRNMEKFCEENDVPLVIVDLKAEIGQGICFVKAVLAKKKGLTGCTVCGIIKKWVLNRWARKMGADVIVTGHNLDDEAQNVLMNYLKGNVSLGVGQGPATGNGDRVGGGFVQRVKPLFFVPEGEVLKYAKDKGFDILYDRCPCALGTYRVDTRGWMKEVMRDEDKRKMVDGFMEVARGLRVEDVREVLKCEVCGEVCRDKICSYCNIVKDI